MVTHKEVMRQALDALESVAGKGKKCDAAIIALRQALGATEPTVPDNMQDWKGMDGTIAWHLIERHADNWADIGKMMDEWLAANQTVLDAPEREPLSDARIDGVLRDYYPCQKYAEYADLCRAIEQEVRGR